LGWYANMSTGKGMDISFEARLARIDISPLITLYHHNRSND
jgi:hypothetical protein